MTTFVLARPLRLSLQASASVAADAQYTAPALVPTLATLSGAASATAGAPHTSVITLDRAADQTYTITWSRTGGGTGVATSQITVGQTSTSAADTWAAAGSGTVDFTIAPSLTRAGRPLNVTISAISPGDLPSFTVSPSVTGLQPFAFGHAFAQGDVPSGQIANASGVVDWQFSPLTYWADGSVKHAIIAGRASVTSGVDSAFPLFTDPTPSGTALTESDLTTALGGTAVVIGVDADSTTLGSLIGTAALHTTVCTGPVMSSWVYRRAVSGNAHLVVFMEVRLFKGGAVEIFPWVENGYLSVASPTNYVKTCAVTIGGVSRFSQSIDIKHHTRIPLLSGTSYSYWTGTDPGITPKHDKAYFAKTKLIPNIGSWGVTLDATLNDTTQYPQSYTPNTIAHDDNASGSTGGSGSIISDRDARYIVTNGDVRAWRSMMTHALSSGSWSHHYRDSATQLPLAYSSYGTRQLDDGGSPAIASGTGGENVVTVSPDGGPAITHSPSYAFVPFLVTGRWWFLEELHFWATYFFISRTPAYRDYANAQIGTRSGYNARGGAWALAVTAHCATITPTSHPLQSQFVASWQNSMAHLYGTYVSGTLEGGTWVHPQGILGTHNATGNSSDGYVPLDASTAWWDAGFMHNYVVAVLGYTSDIGIPQSAGSLANHVATRDHAYKFVIGRADDGYEGRYNWRRFTVFSYPVGTDATGLPVETKYTAAQSFAELAKWQVDPALPSEFGLSLKRHPDQFGGTPIGDDDMTDSDTSRGYASPALMALAMAVDHEQPGANLGYLRITSASNFATAFTTYLRDEAPNWGAVPRTPVSITIPSSGAVTDLGTATLNAGVGRTVNWWVAWSGVAWAPWWGTAGSILAFGGGHTDGDQNDGARLDIATGAFSMIKSPPATAYAKAAGNLVADTSTDGWMWANTTPGDTTMQTGESPAQHHYGGLLAIPSNAISSLGATYGLLCHVGQAAIANNGDNGSKSIHVLRMGMDQQYTRYGPSSASLSHHRAQRGTCYDAKRNRVWFPQHNASDPSVTFAYRDMSDGSEGTQAFTLQGGMSAWASSYDSMEWSSRHDCIVRIMEVPGTSPREYTKIIVLDLATNLAYQPAQTGTPPGGDNSFAAGWSDALNCFVVLRGSSGDNKVYFCKPSGNPRTGSWAWTSQTITSGTVRAAQGNPAFNRLRHVTALGNVLLWCADARYPVQLIGVTPP